MLFSGDTIARPLHPFSGISCPLIVLRPESRGTVRIKSADPREPPAIQPRYLSAAKDRDTTIAGHARLSPHHGGAGHCAVHRGRA